MVLGFEVDPEEFDEDVLEFFRCRAATIAPTATTTIKICKTKIWTAPGGIHEVDHGMPCPNLPGKAPLPGRVKFPAIVKLPNPEKFPLLGKLPFAKPPPHYSEKES